MLNISNVNIAVLIPCYNEQQTIAKVVKDFQASLPQATIYVYDNNSTDNTAAEAKAAGAVVRFERLQGKGHVLRRMFADIEADVYVLVDGDATYEAKCAPDLVSCLLENHLDMVKGARVSTSEEAYRLGHTFGNKLLTGLVQRIFAARFKDMLSGYHVFSRRFVKSFPISSAGFEIETELTVHALELNMSTMEIETPYYARPEGSISKLSTFRDGWRILFMIISLVKKEKPLAFFSLIATMLALVAVFLAFPIFIHFFETGLVPRLPTAILSVSLMILGFLSFACGLILDTVTHGRKEVKQLHYLSIKYKNTIDYDYHG